MTLRPLIEADGPEFERVVELSRADWEPWTPAREAGTSDRELFVRELARGTNGARAGTHLRLGAFAGDGTLVGLFALNEIVLGVFQSAYASWQVSSDRAGRGFGTEGVAGLIDIAFDQAPLGVGLHRVQANIMPANEASIRIATKVGFRQEGLARRYLRIAGAWEDHVMFAITREDRA